MKDAHTHSVGETQTTLMRSKDQTRPRSHHHENDPMTPPTRSLTLLLMLALATALTACGDSGEAEDNNGEPPWVGLNNPFAGDAAAATEGKVAYDNENCAGCHGRNGNDGNLLDLSTIADAPEGRLFLSISEGIEGTAMTSYGGRVSEEDIWKMVTWVQTVEPAQ